MYLPCSFRVPAIDFTCTWGGPSPVLAAARRAGQPGDGAGQGRAGALSRARGRFTRRPATWSRWRPPRLVWRRP